MEEDFDDITETENIEFAGGFLGGYSEPEKGLNDLSGAIHTIPGILGTLSQLPGGSLVVEKIGPIMSQIMSIAKMILSLNGGMKNLQSKVLSDVSNVMNTAMNSAVVASNAATNKVLENAGIPIPPPESPDGSNAEEGVEGVRAGLEDDGSGEGTGSNTGEGTGSNTGEGTGSNTGEGTGSNTGEGTGSNTGEGTGSNTGEGTGSNTGEGTSSNTGEGTGSNTGEGTGSNTGEGTGSNTGENPGSNTGEVPSNNSSGGGRRRTVKWRNHLTRRKRK